VTDEKTTSLIERSGGLFLAKPSIPNELAAVVREALNQLEK
jgi:hypothetical protein